MPGPPWALDPELNWEPLLFVGVAAADLGDALLSWHSQSFTSGRGLRAARSTQVLSGRVH